MNGNDLIIAATAAAEKLLPPGHINGWLAALRLLAPDIIRAINTDRLAAETIEFVDKTKKKTPAKAKKKAV